jgi:hypothetical protein
VYTTSIQGSTLYVDSWAYCNMLPTISTVLPCRKGHQEIEQTLLNLSTAVLKASCCAVGECLKYRSQTVLPKRGTCCSRLSRRLAGPSVLQLLESPGALWSTPSTSLDFELQQPLQTWNPHDCVSLGG